jgi:hypothetical protein
MSEYSALSINRGHTKLARRGASSTGKFVPALQWERLQSPERVIPGERRLRISDVSVIGPANLDKQLPSYHQPLTGFNPALIE